MSDETAGESARARLIGWLLAIVMLAHSLLIVILPRLEKESAIRDVARSWHYTIGSLLLLLAIWRLWLWWKERGALATDSLPPALRFWHGTLALSLLVLLALGGPLGFFYGWAEGRMLSFSGLITIPTLMAKDHAVWQFTGYFHSAMANATVLIAVVAVLSAAYSFARYGKGLFSAFPAGFGFIFLARATIFIYAVNSFRELRPGFIAGAIFLGLVLAFWLIVRAARAGKFAAIREGAAGITAKGAALVGVCAVIASGLYMPHLLFRVTPFATGVMIEADPDITWHLERVAEVDIPPATQFELTTGQETYKWCTFCHTMQPGGAHLVGPNLHNIFGQQAGTVPNFHYSPELVAAGENGLVWTEETLIQYIAGPDQMVPGTKMIISSGPVTDPALQRAVVNALKRDAMSDPVETPAP